MSIKLKMLLIVFVPLCAVFLGIKLWDYAQVEGASKQEIKSTLLEKAQNYSFRVDSLLRQASAAASGMADLMSAIETIDENEIYRALERNVRGNPLIFGSAIAFVPGAFAGRQRFSPYVYRAGDSVKRMDIGTEGYDYTEPQWEWFNRPIGSRRAVWTNLYFDEGAGNIFMVTYSAPIFRDKDVIGVVTVDLDTSKILALSGIVDTQPQNLIIADRAGRIVYGSDSSKIGRSIYETNYFSKAESLRLGGLMKSAEPQVIDLKGSDKDTIWLAASQIGSADWLFLIATSSDFLLQALRAQTIRVVAAIIAILFVFIALAWFLISRVMKPITIVASAADEIAEGRFDAPLPMASGDEVGRLTRAFAAMREQVLEREDALTTLNETLEDRVEQRTHELAVSDNNLQLTLDNMPGALIVTGADLHIKVISSNFNEYVNLPPDYIRPGDSHEKIIRYMAQKGYYGDAKDVDALVQERVESVMDPTSEVLYDYLPDGRVNAVTRKKSAEGDVVTVVVDVTEQINRERELVEAKAILDEKTLMLEDLSSKLSKYLSPQISEALFSGKADASIRTQRKKLTIFFSDIRNFTSTTEEMEPEDVTFLLNDYLTKMTEIVLEYGGTIDKYVGDAILVFFGDPDSKGVKEDALAAVRMAVAMQRRMVDLRAKWSDMGFLHPFEIRCGINTGYCNVGNFGSEQRVDYTIIGGQVNLAARLESICEPGSIAIAHETYTHIRDEFDVEPMAPVRVKGIAEPVQPYAVKGILEERDASERYIRSSNIGGLRLWVDLKRLKDEDRQASIKEFESAIARLKGLEHCTGDKGS